jgi:hypothetical protein
LVVSRRLTHRGLAGGGEALGVIERFQLLELALDALGDLVDGVLDRGARPLRLDQHGLDGEGRILLAAEAEIGHHAGDRARQHEVPVERPVPQRPFGQVDVFHCAAPVSTFFTARPR